MIAQGAIFSHLRAQMLNSFPEETVAPFRDDATIGDWLENGAFIVTSCTKKEVLIEASPTDYAAIVLTETENLMNHCFEHLQEMIALGCDGRLRSNAWAIVTAYYFGFFASSAFLRLIGQPVVFLATSQLNRLKILAGATEKPGQGAFRFQVTRNISVTRAEISVTQTEKVHEATWKLALGLLDRLNHDPLLTKSPAEANFYDSVCSRVLFPQYANYQWPSMVRNRANYRPGFMYRLQNDAALFSRLFDPWRSATRADIHRLFQTCLRRCEYDRDSFSHHTDLMLNVSTVLFLLARALYNDLLDRRKTDRRWEHQRRRYGRLMGVPKRQFEALLPPA
jgi:hypothetical protein